MGLLKYVIKKTRLNSIESQPKKVVVVLVVIVVVFFAVVSVVVGVNVVGGVVFVVTIFGH